MKLLLMVLLFVIGCGVPKSEPAGKEDIPSFQSYQFGFQDVIPNTMTKIQASVLAQGDYTHYSSELSRWTPVKTGLYYIDEQLLIKGTFTDPSLTVALYLNLDKDPYLKNSQTLLVPTGIEIQQKFSINGLVCFYENYEYTEAWMQISQPAQIISEWSQFEGFYVGPCPGTPK